MKVASFKLLSLFLIMTFISCAYGETFWQLLRQYFITSFNDIGLVWESQYAIIEQPFQPKPDPLFPALKLFVYVRQFNPTTFALINRIDLNNLNEFITNLNYNGFPTVLYAYGFLDKPVKFNAEGLFEMTTSTMVFWPYIYRILIGEAIKRNTGTVPPKSMYTNIILVDWSEYNTDYIKSLASLPAIANAIGDKLYAMSQNTTNPLNLSTWHFIGHSLGAHLVAQIARRIKERAGKTAIPRVTGLDPAGPIIEFPVIRDFYSRFDKDCGGCKYF